MNQEEEKMKRFSKILVISLAMIFMVTTAYAGDTAQQPSATEPPSKKVAWIASHMQNEFVLDMAKAAEASGKASGWEVTTFDPNLDLNTQISQIETAVTQGYAAVMFDPISYDGMTGVVENVTKNYNIPIITIHGSASAQDLLTAFVAVDLAKGGELKMERAVKDLGGKGNIAIMTGTEGQTTAMLITSGYEKVLKDYPDINVVFKGAGNWNSADATPLAENWLSSGKPLDAIVCNNDGMALGVRAVLANSGKTGQLKLYGLDATKEGRVAVRSGEFDASIWIDTAAEFVEAFKVIDAFYAGKPYEKEVLVVPKLVTKENIDELFPND
jgi:inositol transport system substrate-binding protein